MTAHAPGPWVVAKSGVSVDAGLTRIRQENAGPREVLAANARLIAAAPELLAALKGCTEAMVMWAAEEDGLPEGHGIGAFEAYQRAIGVIAKAGGRS